MFFLQILVKRLRTDKLTPEEVVQTVSSIPQNLPGPSLLGKRAHESSQSESENENSPETESNHCSRTL